MVAHLISLLEYPEVLPFLLLLKLSTLCGCIGLDLCLIVQIHSIIVLHLPLVVGNFDVCCFFDLVLSSHDRSPFVEHLLSLFDREVPFLDWRCLVSNSDPIVKIKSRSSLLDLTC